ncbi:MAG: recombination mediator RecR [Bdellovibrionota bacterium]
MENQTIDIGALENLIPALKQLPGIGEKTATRLSHHIIRQPEIYAQTLAHSILEARQKLQTCAVCCNFTETPICAICSHPQRRSDLVCVVETPADLAAFEKARHFAGKYHVLHGSISPLDGVHENKLKIKELQDRIKADQVQEVILATNPTVEGDTTALYIARLIKNNGLKVSRIAYGIPVGSEIEYLDGATLGKALQNRVAL